MGEEKTLILDQKKINQKVYRMACEILEDNHTEKEIILAGIKGGGYFFAEKLFQRLKTIDLIPVSLHKIRLKKKDPLSEEITINGEPEDWNNKVVILVDDVAKSGKTLFYALHPFMHCRPRKIQVAVLVDRKHKRYPVSADYVGLSLATTIQEHISVEISDKREVVYLI